MRYFHLQSAYHLKMFESEYYHLQDQDVNDARFLPESAQEDQIEPDTDVFLKFVSLKQR